MIDTENISVTSLALAAFEEQRVLERKPFPVRSLLILYLRAPNYVVYKNYFEGFKLLAAWLSPIDTSAITIYPRKHVSHLFMSYELNKLAEILDVNVYSLWQFMVNLTIVLDLMENTNHE